jgi:hypothetical protein
MEIQSQQENLKERDCFWTLKHRKEINGKIVPTQAVKAFGDSTRIAPGIFNVGAR